MGKPKGLEYKVKDGEDIVTVTISKPMNRQRTQLLVKRLMKTLNSV